MFTAMQVDVTAGAAELDCEAMQPTLLFSACTALSLMPLWGKGANC